MTTLISPTTPTADAVISIQQPRLPSWPPVGVAAGSIVVGAVLGAVLGWGVVLVALVAAVLNLVVLQAWSRRVETRRVAVDRLVTSLVWYALLVALVPLGSLVCTVWDRGHGVLSGQFLTY